jgi:hypothetical protein
MPIRLPLTANKLTDAAYEQVELESKEVEAEMMGEILPRSVQVILQFDDLSSRTAKTHPSMRSESVIREIAQTLWSYPGSYGATRIKNSLRQEGLSDEEAEEISQTIFNLTRYPLSIVNYMRHMRSSINSISNIFYGPKAPESIFSELGYTASQIQDWIASSNSLNTTRINDEKDFQNWLAEVEVHLRTFSPMQARINRAMSGRDLTPRRETPGVFESAAARAYVRRFGNYVAAHAKFKDFGRNAQGKGSTISDEFAELRSIYSGSDKSVYETLKSDLESRSRRLSATVRKSVDDSSRFGSGSSSYQNYIAQSLNINGKKVQIQTSSTQLPATLVQQFIKSLNLQFDMNPDQKVLSTRLNVGKESIEVHIEDPAKADLKKVQTFIESMYLS